MSVLRRVLYLCAMVFSAYVLVSCGGNGGADRQSVRLAYIPYAADLPFFVALDKGMFRQHGIDVEAIECASSSEALDLVLAGRADGAMGNSFSVLFAIHARDTEMIRLINVSCETEEQDRYTGFILVRPGSDISRPTDLRGKTVGTGKGASQALWVQLYFKELGWDPEQDVIVEQEASEVLLNALHAGQLDAVFVFEPYATIGMTRGIAKPLMPFFRRTIIDPFPAGGATLSRTFCDEHPELAEGVIDALDQAIELINSDPDDAKLSLSRYTPLTDEEAAASQIYFWWGSAEIDSRPIQTLADILTEHELLPAAVDVTRMTQ